MSQAVPPPEKSQNPIARDDRLPRPFLTAPALLVLAGAARAYRLRQSLWFDEIYALVHFFRADWLTLLTSAPDPAHHPFYSLLAKLSIQALGESELGVRLPAWLLGTVTAPAIYLGGRRFWDERTGLAAGLLFCFSFWPVWFGQDARGYSGMMLAAVLSQIFWGLLWQSPRPAWTAGYLASAAAGTYFHLYAVFIPLAHLLLALGAWARNPRADSDRPARSAAAAAAGGLALSALLYAPMARDLGSFALGQGQVTAGRDLSWSFLWNLALEWSAGPRHPWLSLPLLAGFALGVCFLAKHDRGKLAALVLPLLLGLGTVLVSRTFVYARFFAYAIPAYLLLSAVGLTQAAQRLPRFRGPAWWLGLLLLLASLAPNLHEYYLYGKQPLREVVEWIQRGNYSGRVLTVGLVSEAWHYYDHSARAVPPGFELNPEVVNQSLVIVSHPWSVGKDNLDFLHRFCGPPRRFPAAGYPENSIEVYRCDQLR